MFYHCQRIILHLVFIFLSLFWVWVLENASMKPSILRAHFTSCHFTHEHGDHRFLLAKRTQFRAAGTLPSLGFVSEDKSELEAFYHVA